MNDPIIPPEQDNQRSITTNAEGIRWWRAAIQPNQCGIKPLIDDPTSTKNAPDIRQRTFLWIASNDRPKTIILKANP